MTKKLISGVSVIAIALTATPVFAQTISIKDVIQTIVGNLDELSKTTKTSKTKDLEVRKTTFGNILKLAIAEATDLSNTLIKIKTDPPLDDLKNKSLKQIGNWMSYYQTVSDTLNNQEMTAAALKELARQFKNWRQAAYHPSLQKIINTLLVLEGQNVLKTANNRLNSIAADLKKVGTLEIIKESPLPSLINNAQRSLAEAKKLQEAIILIMFKTDETDIQKLIEEMLAKVQQTYDYFSQMSDWLEETAKKQP